MVTLTAWPQTMEQPCLSGPPAVLQSDGKLQCPRLQSPPTSRGHAPDGSRECTHQTCPASGHGEALFGAKEFQTTVRDGTSSTANMEGEVSNQDLDHVPLQEPFAYLYADMCHVGSTIDKQCSILTFILTGTWKLNWLLLDDQQSG